MQEEKNGIKLKKENTENGNEWIKLARGWWYL